MTNTYLRDFPLDTPVPIQEWIQTRILDKEEERKDLIYGEEGLNQTIFVRDKISTILARNSEEYRSIVTVVGEHTSKSVKLPVYKITTDAFDLIMRCNFYDWKVSVFSKRGPLKLDLVDLISRERTDESECKYEDQKRDVLRGRIFPGYCEGFADEWVLPYYAVNQERFTVEVRNHYSLYTLIWLLRRQCAADFKLKD